jgi:hypothetical protein
MRNLRFTLELGPDADYLTCEAFGFYKHPIPTSTTRHLVVDLSQIKRSPLHRPRQGLPAISFAVAAAPAVMQDQRTEECLALDRGDPNSDGEGDQQQQQPAENAENEQPADQAAEGQEQGPANLEPKAGQNQRMRLADILPLPLPIRRIHEKLRKDTELLKLHLKHFHISLEQFKRRTSELQLQSEIYDKYTEICRACEACANSARPPARSRISGLRASNFGDLVFMDHCEIKIRLTTLCC